MKFASMLMTLMSVVISLSSFAQSPEPYRLMGKGIQKRNSNESLALVCIDWQEKCKGMQFVLFHENLTVENIGPIFKMPEAPTELLEEKAVKAQMAYYFATNHDARHEEERSARFRNTASWAVMIGATLYGVSLGAVTVATAGTIFVPIALAGIFLRAFPPPSLESFIINSGEDMSVSRLNDQTGWSWSESPKIIKAKKFDLVVSHIRGRTRYYSNTSSTIRRAERRKERLEKQGVDFGHGRNF